MNESSINKSSLASLRKSECCCFDLFHLLCHLLRRHTKFMPLLWRCINFVSLPCWRCKKIMSLLQLCANSCCGGAKVFVSDCSTLHHNSIASRSYEEFGFWGSDHNIDSFHNVIASSQHLTAPIRDCTAELESDCAHHSATQNSMAEAANSNVRKRAHGIDSFGDGVEL